MCTYVSTINTTPAFTEPAGRKEVSRGGHDVEPEGLLGQQPTHSTGSETSLRSQKLARFFGRLILCLAYAYVCMWGLQVSIRCLQLLSNF